VSFGLNCSGGLSAACEPSYSISLSPSFDVDGPPLLLAPGVSFSYNVTIRNTAQDDGVSPILVLDLGNGIILNSTTSRSAGDNVSCESSTTPKPRCPLRNPLHSNTSISLTLWFRFNTTAVPLSTSFLPLTISVVDGSTGNTSTSRTTEIFLRAEASLGIGVM
ncbi:hypothetical protein GBAR_LOCUS3242, partial [Geodia barretti]